MQYQSHVIASFQDHHAAEETVAELYRAGFDSGQVSIVGRGYHTEESVVGFYEMGDRVKVWGKAGAFWGAAWGWLVGLAFFFIPGLGPVMMGGPVIALLISTVEGAVVTGGVTALGAAVYSLGVPKKTVLDCELAIKADRYLIMVHGESHDIEKARELLRQHGAAELGTTLPATEAVPA